VVLPGGLGTFEELFEVWTWAHLGLHASPMGIVNVDGYFDPLLHLVRSGVEAGFVPPRSGDLLVVEDEPRRLVDAVLDRVTDDIVPLDPHRHVGEILAERRRHEPDTTPT
jgi:hypothetical protein